MHAKATLGGLRDATHTPAQLRVLEAAIGLFSQHGISGTSLKMIADAVGVTKAAVYHQYNAKDDIVLAIAGMVTAGLEAALREAEAERSRARRREVLTDRLIALAVARRSMAGILQQDPVMLRFFQENERFRRVMERVELVLMGGVSTPGGKVCAAIINTAIAGAVMHPLTHDLDDELLREELGKQLHRLFTPPR